MTDLTWRRQAEAAFRLALGKLFLDGDGVVQADLGAALAAALDVAAEAIRADERERLIHPVPYRYDPAVPVVRVYEVAAAVAEALRPAGLGMVDRAGVHIECGKGGERWSVWVEDALSPHLHSTCHSRHLCDRTGDGR